MICKKIKFLLISFFILCLPSFSFQKARVEYEDNTIDYSVLDGQSVLQEADNFFAQYLQTGDKQALSTASAKYYILNKIYPAQMYPTVQLARTYDERHLDRYAKEYFYIGYDINKQDPNLNYYFGDFYYKRHDYKRALRYFKVAYSHGYENYYDLVFKIATIYEKFADLKNAKYYYERAYSLNSDMRLQQKINDLKNLK